MASFTNQATISYNGTVRNSNITTGEVLEVLNVSKTALRGTYIPGETVTYAVSLVNTGTTALSGLTVTDDLGRYEAGGVTVYPLSYIEGSARVFINGVPQTAADVTAGPPLTVSGVTVPAGGNFILLYEAQITDFAPPAADSVITNTVSAEGGCLVTPVTAEETIAAAQEPNLTITKSVSPTSVSGCSPLTYTFVIQNVGNEEAGADDNVVLTDTFSPALENITVTLNGDVLPADAYSYNEETGAFATLPGAITVPAATFTQDPATGQWITDPGVTVLTVTGTI
ncbi:MAG: DUF11 domain-containing protein [Clostridia bacterium]|nr:DUF11 domain-containing protein [Clostridia bacterium]